MSPQFPQDRAPGDLAALIRKGDARAEQDLARLYRPKIVCFLQVRTRNSEVAEDLAQEVLIAVLCSLRQGRVRDADNLAAYVHGTARNLLNNYFRAQGREKTDHLDPTIEILEPGPDFEKMEREREVERAIRELPMEDRKILLMTLVEGSGPAEIATALSLSPDVVRQRKSRALKKLTERFNPLSQIHADTPPTHVTRRHSGRES